MKFLRNFTAWMMTLLCFFSLSGTSALLFAMTPQSKTVITDFAPVEPVSYSVSVVQTLAQAQEMLLMHASSVGVNGNAGTVPVVRWEMAEDSIARFEAKEAGIYIFTAVLGVSPEYETVGILLPLPMVTVMLMPAEQPLQTIYSFDPIEDIVLASGSIEAAQYTTLADAQAALLTKYSTVLVNNGEFSVEICSWILEGGAAWDSGKAGEYIFSGNLTSPGDYTIDIPDLPKIRVRFTKTEKAAIDSFAVFSKLSISSANPYGYRTEAEAIKTLTSLYTTVKVNGTTDIIPILSWHRTSTTAYNTDEGSAYTFTAVLGQSEKYDIKKVSCALPTLQLEFCAPDSYVSVQLTDEKDEPLFLAIVGLYNEDVFYYAYTNSQGKCVFYNVAGGTYSMVMTHGDQKCSRTVTVRSGYSSALTWRVSSGEAVYSGKEDSELTETTTAKSETTKKPAAASTTAERSTYEILAEQLQNALASGNPSSVTLFDSVLENGGRIRIYPGEMTAGQRTSVQSMTVTALAEEIKKALTALTRMRFSGSAVKARNAVLKAASGTETLILPIHFSKHAEFAFPLTISMDTGEEDMGFEKGTCYLYYYNSDSGELEESGIASANGTGAFTFTLEHCSDYFLLNIPLGKDPASVQSPMDLPAGADTSAEVSLVISQKPAGNKVTRRPEPTIICIGEVGQADFAYGPLVLAGGFVLILIVGIILRRRTSRKEE